MKPDNVEVRWNMLVASIIRDVLYQPDGKPPADWTIQQDLWIAKRLIALRDRSDLEAAIRGLRIIYPTGKLTLKLLHAKRSKGLGELLFNRAVRKYYDSLKRVPSKLQQLGISYTPPAA
jgi:hypothetical protein